MTAIYGHRGAMGVYPENTIESFQKALDDGVDGIELDVQWTKDKQLIVMHDPTVDRTTNGSGRVDQMTLREIKAFSAGTPFSHLKGYDHKAWAQIKVPTLQEVLALMQPYGIEVNIELKPNLAQHQGIEQALLEAVEAYGKGLTFIYSSFHLPILKRLREEGIHTDLAWLVKQDVAYPIDYLNTFKFNTFHVSRKVILKERSFLERAGLLQDIRVWTVNEEREIRALLKKQVKAIMTDFPARAIKIKEQLKSSGV